MPFDIVCYHVQRAAMLRILHVEAKIPTSIMGRGSIGMPRLTSALSSSGMHTCLLAPCCVLSLLTVEIVALGATPAPAGREALVTVKGVTYPFATFGIIKRLEQMPGVEHVTFDLKDGLADVKLKPGAEITDEQLRAAVKNASYTPGDIKWLPDPSHPAQ